MKAARNSSKMGKQRVKNKCIDAIMENASLLSTDYTSSKDTSTFTQSDDSLFNLVN